MHRQHGDYPDAACFSPDVPQRHSADAVAVLPHLVLRRHPWGSRAVPPIRHAPCHRWVRGKIAINPGHDQSCQLIDLLSTQFSAPRNMVPFLDASAAAACGGVLGGEHRMTTPRRLSPVFRRLGRANPLGEHLMRMPVNEFTPFAPRIFGVVRTQRE